MSTTSIIEVVNTWFGKGPGSPRYCQLIGRAVTRVAQFGDATGGVADERLVLGFQDPVNRVTVPLSGLLWRVPDLATTTMTDSEKVRVQELWPRLRRLSGAPFGVSDARGSLDREAVLLEVWPSGFRRLEYLFSSLEVPTTAGDFELPQAPAPRWFCIHGIAEPDLRSSVQAIANAQHAPGPAPTIEGFMKGLAPVLVEAGSVLGTFEDGQQLEVRAFDLTGLPIDPDFVFDRFRRLANDSDFMRLKVDHPDGPFQWQAANRHVLVFSDHIGRPYRVLDAEDVPAGEIPEPIPERTLRVLTADPGDRPIPDSGVVVFPEGTGWEGLDEEMVGLAVDGDHVRIGLHPHGDLAPSITVSFAPRMFARVRVIDYRQWFPRNPNPRNQLARYTEGNLLTPYLCGRDFLREIHRTLRGTYEQVPPDPAAYDPRASLPPADASRSKVFLTNAWIDAHTQLVGRRGMIAAPRTQPQALVDLPDAQTLLDGLTIVAVAPVPGVFDHAGRVQGERQWWLVSRAFALPPGAYIDIRQIQIADDIHGDDPRLPGIELNADVYGIAVPLRKDAATAFGFASTVGRFVLPAIYSVTDEPRARMRIALWEEGTERQVVRGYGEVMLPPLASPTIPPPFTGDPPASLRLEYDGRPGIVIVRLDAGVLTQARAVVVVNPRSGEVVAADHGAGAAVAIELSDFSLRDRALVGFLVPGDHEPSHCTHFFELYQGHALFDSDHENAAGAAALSAGVAPAHPTELAGALRGAIAAGVDVRLLAWKDPTKATPYQLSATLGAVNVVNAQIGARRGQAIWDSIGRESFFVHHQKGSFFRTADLRFVAFLGGIDLLLARWDTPEHRSLDPDRPSGPWHDIQCRIDGKAAWDVYRNTRDRWNAAHARPDIVGSDPGRTTLPAPDGPEWGPTPVVDDPLLTKSDGPHAVQINRTIAPRIEAYSGAVAPFNFTSPETGDLSFREAYRRVIAEARWFLYIEDQYFWDLDIARRLHERLFTGKLEFLFLLLPKRLSEAPQFDQVVYALRRRALHILLFGNEAGPTGSPFEDVTGRVALFNIASPEDLDPIYVHCKIAIADDLWMEIGSGNLTRRSMTWDSEINAACVDTRIRRGIHLSAQEFRIALLSQHLRLRPDESPLVEDPRVAFDLVRAVLAGQVPWRRTEIVPMDLNHTHYGPIAPELDATFEDAIRLVADPDGEPIDFPLRLIDFATLFEALGQSQGNLPFGGLGRLRLTFDVSALGDPANIQVRVEMRRSDAPAAAFVVLGRFAASSPADAGVLAVGVTYELRAVAEPSSAPGTVLGSLTPPLVPTTDFVTTVPLVF